MKKFSGIIGILGAMDAEIQEILKHSDILKKIEWHGFLFYSINLEGKKAVLVKCGVGKVFAALVSQHLIDTYNPSALIFTGVAGALNANLNIGDVVISRDCVQHDVDGIALGFARGNLLYTEYKFLVADAHLIGLALKTNLENHAITAGRILTGDQFMSRDAINHHRYLMDELMGDAVEMEGGAMAQVCAVNKIPFLVIRTISDRADGDAVADFNKFLPLVAHNSLAVLKQIFTHLK